MVSGGAMRELGPIFEKAIGHKASIQFANNPILKQQVEAGAKFDVLIIEPEMLDELAKQGKIIADSRTDVARVGMALLARSGAPKADISTVDGFKTRTPFLTTVDLQASYKLPLGKARALTLLADVFNLFDERKVTAYDQWTQLGFQVANPDYGAPVTELLSGRPPQFQAPFEMRLGARLTF